MRHTTPTIPASEAKALLASGKLRVGRPPARARGARQKAPRRAAGSYRGSGLEVTLERLLLAHGLPPGVREHRFALPERQWRFDRCWPDLKVALEIQGGTYSRKNGQGAHSRGRRQREDFEKANAATLRGWRTLYADTDMVTTGAIVDTLRELLRIAAAERGGKSLTVSP